MYTCLKCYKMYEEPGEVACVAQPQDIIQCECDLIEIDEPIIATIINLNSKGYTTNFCCAGHIHLRRVQIYIAFPKEVPVPNELPRDFNFRTRLINGQPGYGGWVISLIKKFEKHEVVERMDLVYRANKNLYNWAVSLPVLV